MRIWVCQITSHGPYHPKSQFIMQRLLFAIVILLPLTLSAQVVEEFTDGDFSFHPVWQGDSTKFRVNGNKQLQLYADGADSAWLAFRYALPDADTITWECWTKESFSPTASNYARICLFADVACYTDASHSLSLVVADPVANDKRVALYLDGAMLLQFPCRLSASTNAMRFRLRLVDGLRLQCWMDTVGAVDAVDWTAVGECLVSLPAVDSAWMGVECHFTASRSRHFYFDDIRISSSADSTSADNPVSHHLYEGSLIVNELLFNPPPGGADYVELYNATDSVIDLSDVRLAHWVGDSINRLYSLQGSVAPHDFVVITTDAAFVASHYIVHHLAKIVEVDAMPAYNDAAGTVLVMDADSTVIDRFDYSESMHSRLLRDVEGVALERRSYGAATQDAANWYSAASTAGYGTPTYSNSQSRELLYVDNDFLIEPSLFSPDGDGYEDLLNLSWQLQLCDLSANINIYDTHGRLVRHLARGATLGCVGVITWDGLDDAGLHCRQGNYIITIEAYSPSGAKQSIRRVVALVVR